LFVIVVVFIANIFYFILTQVEQNETNATIKELRKVVDTQREEIAKTTAAHEACYKQQQQLLKEKEAWLLVCLLFVVVSC